MLTYKKLESGDPAPWFKQASTSNASYSFDTIAGRYVALCFFGTAFDPRSREALRILEEERALFDDRQVSFFGVSVDSTDKTEQRVQGAIPGIRFFWDFDASVSRLYGAAPADAKDGRGPLRRLWVILDPTLRVRAVVPFREDGGDRRQVADLLRALPPVGQTPGFAVQAPVIVLPDVLDAELCRRLIGLYEEHGGSDSGFMREIDGKTVGVKDHSHKKRSDFTIEDVGLKAVLRQKITRKVIPDILKVYQFHATRMERYIVGCYDGETGGYFRPHRDNTTKGTAHRRFALSINLNEEFEGGEISFPEYGPRSFKPPRGGAVVFSCSLLHAVSPVLSGRRYAFLPFLYDDAAAAIREANNRYLDEGVVAYRG